MRLAKTNELDSELMNLALKSNPKVMIEAADYLNEKVRGRRPLALACLLPLPLACLLPLPGWGSTHLFYVG